jgi:hypothetical protein
MNVSHYSGRISTRGVELRYQSNGKPELTFTLRVPNGERDGKRFTLPVAVTVYGHVCEDLAASLEPNDLVELTGQNTWPKPATKPGGAAIPAAVCFGVTRLTESATDERADEAGTLASDPEPVATPASKPPRRRPYPRQALAGGFDQN